MQSAGIEMFHAWRGTYCVASDVGALPIRNTEGRLMYDPTQALLIITGSFERGEMLMKMSAAADHRPQVEPSIPSVHCRPSVTAGNHRRLATANEREKKIPLAVIGKMQNSRRLFTYAIYYII